MAAWPDWNTVNAFCANDPHRWPSIIWFRRKRIVERDFGKDLPKPNCTKALISVGAAIQAFIDSTMKWHWPEISTALNYSKPMTLCCVTVRGSPNKSHNERIIEPMDANFWHSKWEQNDIAWHQNTPNEYLVRIEPKLNLGYWAEVLKSRALNSMN